MSDYNAAHWEKKIVTYLAEEWAQHASPFVRMVRPHLAEGGHVLELGAGAGQDGVWLSSQGFKVTSTDASEVAFAEIEKASVGKIKPLVMDISQPFPLPDEAFDAVYAQLVLHYFDDEVMHSIMNEIHRVLRPGGILACMVNSVRDPEYDLAKVDASGRINANGLVKRFFSKDSFAPFVSAFETIIFDEQGRTPKDDAVGTVGMVQFIGRK